MLIYNARHVLAVKGGVIIHDSGRVEAIGPIEGEISGRPVLRGVA